MSSYTVITVWLCFLAVSAIGATSETTPRTTTPGTTIPPGSCEFNGKIYENGAVMEEDPYNCYGTTCEDGNVLTWDAACMFHTPVCYGRSEKVLGQCCPVCHDNVTTVPTTIPRSTTPPGGCHYNGKTYANGAKIETDPNKCYGLFCQDGQTVAWDDQCAFHTPYCAGKSEKVAGQCCPVCHNQTTTPPQTTTTPSIPADGCLGNGKVFTGKMVIFFIYLWHKIIEFPIFYD
ncbi:cysteine-rich motor neuron 1 protein-like [Ruditapes philippinarum]|uniref:cysteine-rich motor neuron 1 protein-like n=1 Tax=Ruditapes philippinarum TaxID=129788 RepID=UPI00295BE2A4|nr:cysteine-rich motor neuron 1 protein-like [Ruditapes philippinarum]